MRNQRSRSPARGPAWGTDKCTLDGGVCASARAHADFCFRADVCTHSRGVSRPLLTSCGGQNSPFHASVEHPCRCASSQVCYHAFSCTTGQCYSMQWASACVRTTSRILLDPSKFLGSVFGLALVSSARMHAGCFTYGHMRMHIRMCRFALDGMATCRASRRVWPTACTLQLILPRDVAQCNSRRQGERNE